MPTSPVIADIRMSVIAWSDSIANPAAEPRTTAACVIPFVAVAIGVGIAVAVAAEAAGFDLEQLKEYKPNITTSEIPHNTINAFFTFLPPFLYDLIIF
jgi:hypothetical protein